MIDPINSLAFSMHANKGVYALLLGSGISRTSKIPTGWEITLELVRKVASLQDESCEPDPEGWYVSKYGKAPDYSDLLDAVAKTPSERQQLLRGYWEPTEAEREEGAKQPTKAHRAIADLVRAGFIRVILTTNFDKLMETALHDAGVVPTVLSTPDHVEGALPLVHTPCTLIKVHGDYLDTRIRNTPEELAEYPEPFNRILDRIFDEYGLIVCGWSAEWDQALRNALTRAPYRRFTTYWASRGEPGLAAKDLIARKGAQVIQIDGADSFFSTVKEQVEALETFSRPHPLSAEAAVASLKKYLSETKYRIQLEDLVSAEVGRVVDAIQSNAFNPNDSFDAASLEKRVRAYEAACGTLIRMAFTSGYWADKEQLRAWEHALVRLAYKKYSNGLTPWLELQRYPATLTLYALGLGAVAAKRYESLKLLFDVSLPREYGEEQKVLDVLPPSVLFQMNGKQWMQMLPGMERRHAPLNDWLHDYFAAIAVSAYGESHSYTLGFDSFEVFIALGAGLAEVRAGNTRHWFPPGAYGYRSNNREKIVKTIRDDLASAGAASRFVASGLFGKDSAECKAVLSAFEAFVPQLRWY
ncbi:MAG TPA: SIR2 family protein [Noviherbaspirillum sp.]|nr:SIR2 family protein [Noviherbaspirillum sp.]